MKKYCIFKTTEIRNCSRFRWFHHLFKFCFNIITGWRKVLISLWCFVPLPKNVSHIKSSVRTARGQRPLQTACVPVWLYIAGDLEPSILVHYIPPDRSSNKVSQRKYIYKCVYFNVISKIKDHSIKIHISDLGCKIIAAGKIFAIKIKSKSKQVKRISVL